LSKISTGSFEKKTRKFFSHGITKKSVSFKKQVQYNAIFSLCSVLGTVKITFNCVIFKTSGFLLELFFGVCLTCEQRIWHTEQYYFK